MSDEEILEKIVNVLQENNVCVDVNDIKDFHLTLSGSECDLVYKFSCKDKNYHYIIDTFNESLYEI